MISDQIKSLNMFRRRDITSKQLLIRKRSFLILVAGILIMISEIGWVGYTVHRELNTPILQLQASIGLLKYVLAPTPQLRQKYFEELENKNIYIWPNDGIELEFVPSRLIEKMEKVLQTNYPEEYATLDSNAKYILLNYTFLHVNQDILNRTQQWVWLEEDQIDGLNVEDEEILFSLAAEYVGSSRYRWHGYNKSLYYTIIHQSEQDNFLLFFASVSDIADKFNILKALSLPSGLFLLTTFFLIGAGIYDRFLQEKKYRNILEQQVDERTHTLKITNQQLYTEIRERKEIDASLQKFVPHEFLRLLGKKSITEIAHGESIEKYMTILFSDIRSFSTLSETMKPEENFKFLNSYLKQMGPVIRQYHGFIDKYIGDGIMALFDRSVDDAVKAGLAMLRQLEVYNQGRQRANFQPIQIGIGINTGNLMLGTIGEEHRMEGTVISDAVNLAARIEGLTKIYGTPLLITENTFYDLKNPEQFSSRFIDRVRVKGKDNPIIIYEIFDADLPEIKAKKLENAELFEKAWYKYQNKNFEQAEALFRDCQKSNPEDKAAQVYIERCQYFLEVGYDENWEGITSLRND